MVYPAVIPTSSAVGPRSSSSGDLRRHPMNHARLLHPTSVGLAPWWGTPGKCKRSEVWLVSYAVMPLCPHVPPKKESFQFLQGVCHFLQCPNGEYHVFEGWPMKLKDAYIVNLKVSIPPF